DYNSAIRLNPANSAAYYGRGYAYNKLNNQRNAISDLTKAIEVGNDTRNAKVIYAGPLQKGTLNSLRAAIKDRGRIETFSEDRSEAYYTRGVANFMNGDEKDALLDLNKSIELNPTYADAHFKRGMVRSAMGLQYEAIADFSNTIKIDGSYAEAYYMRGLIKQTIGDVNGGCYDLSRAGELGYSSSYNIIREYCN
ncbi:MAG: tetratricopeptide repeat protein, partial [Spirosomaceae bacterium]|nr:tetratricopeptide repeat protein [Spirosomataceae bacterium]